MTCGCGAYKTDRRLSDEADCRDADDTEDGHDEDEYVALGDDAGDDSDAGNDEGHLLWPMQVMNLLHIAPHRRVHHSRDETPQNATLQSARGRRLEVLGPSSQVRRQATKSPEILFKRLHDLQVQQKNTLKKNKKKHEHKVESRAASMPMISLAALCVSSCKDLQLKTSLDGKLHKQIHECKHDDEHA